MKKIILGGLIIAAAITLVSCVKSTVLSPEAAKTAAQNFINANLVSADNPVTITEIIEDNGLYKLTVNFTDGRNVTSYMTMDGKKFFAEAIDITAAQAQGQPQETETPSAQIVKSEKPIIELFVMSHCPYGTQIEKGIIPVVETLGDSIDFQVKFCDYAMHGQEELNEELQQYCIQKNEPDKFLTYLKCFLADGDGAKCVQETDINLVTLNQCVKVTDEEFQVTEKFSDQSTWISGTYPAFDIYKTEVAQYGVQGSPTLVINGTQVSTGRSPASLLSAVCDAFIKQPVACNTGLSSDTPGPGFGYDTTGSDSGAQCE